MDVRGEKVSEEHGGFRKGRGCVDQIYVMKRLVEEYLGKVKKLYAVLWILRRQTLGLTRESLWSVLKIYGVGEQLLTRMLRLNNILPSCSVAKSE